MPFLDQNLVFFEKIEVFNLWKTCSYVAINNFVTISF